MGFLASLNSALGNEPLPVGIQAPHVTAVAHGNSKVEFADFYKKGIVLVYFYPKADTPGCTAQACSLRDAFDELTQKGVIVIGVSSDTPEEQKKFKEKYQLPFTLIADTHLQVIKAFGVPIIPLVSKATRVSFLIKDGIVVWRDLKVSAKEQANDILKVLPLLTRS